MNPLTIAIIIIAVVLIALVALKAKGVPVQTSTNPDVYFLKKSLFSPAERSFLGILESLDYDGVTVASKVRLADVFGIKKGLQRSDRQRAFNRISAKHVDFLLIQSSDGRPLIGIELDDSSHGADDRMARDSFVDSIFASAGLPILHVVAKSAYDPKEIHRQIDNALTAKG